MKQKIFTFKKDMPSRKIRSRKLDLEKSDLEKNVEYSAEG